MHARKAWLQGLSPKENREIPPLDYARVYRLKAAHPELEIIINGGIGSLEEAAAHLAHVDGVTLGRAAYQNPYLLAEVDRAAVRRRARAALAPRPCSNGWSPTSSAHVAPAAGSTTSPGTSSASTTASRGRAPSAGTFPSGRRARGAGVGVLIEAIRIAEGEAPARMRPRNRPAARLPCGRRSPRNRQPAATRLDCTHADPSDQPTRCLVWSARWPWRSLALAPAPCRRSQLLPPPVGPEKPRVEPTKEHDGLYHQSWFQLSFLDLKEDFAEAKAEGKRFAVVFEQRGCPYCIKLHTEVLALKYINDYVRENSAIVQLDLWGAREVTDFDGKVLIESGRWPSAGA